MEREDDEDEEEGRVRKSGKKRGERKDQADEEEGRIFEGLRGTWVIA